MRGSKKPNQHLCFLPKSGHPPSPVVHRSPFCDLETSLHFVAPRSVLPLSRMVFAHAVGAGETEAAAAKRIRKRSGDAVVRAGGRTWVARRRVGMQIYCVVVGDVGRLVGGKGEKSLKPPNERVLLVLRLRSGECRQILPKHPA